MPGPMGPHPLLEPLCRSWGLRALLLLRQRPTRFNRLRHGLPGCSHKVLTENLRRLERDGLVVRRVRSVVPVEVEYSLSPRGRELAVLLSALVDWVDGSAADMEAARADYDATRTAARGVGLSP